MPIGKIFRGIARIATPLLSTIAGANPLLRIATSFLQSGIQRALGALVQRISSSFINGGNLNIAKNPPLGPFGRATDFLDRTAQTLSNFAQRLQQISQRLQNISSALTKFNEALKTLIEAVTGRSSMEDKVRQAQVSSPSTGQPAATGPPASSSPTTAVAPRANSNPYGIPPMPERPGPNATPEERLRYQELMQERNFAIQMALNSIQQEGVMKANLQKVMNDATMQILNTLR
ncbi:MAG: hypothetical protein NZ585_11030 [Chloracidobacterium sp.]|nr:hypothetical protein [Chloracidobacterium sp.]MDW8218298.1 hypothetical protein [Acidobacteriota bacterium]